MLVSSQSLECFRAKLLLKVMPQCKFAISLKDPNNYALEHNIHFSWKLYGNLMDIFLWKEKPCWIWLHSWLYRQPFHCVITFSVITPRTAPMKLNSDTLSHFCIRNCRAPHWQIVFLGPTTGLCPYACSAAFHCFLTSHWQCSVTRGNRSCLSIQNSSGIHEYSKIHLYTHKGFLHTYFLLFSLLSFRDHLVTSCKLYAFRL